jgi:hypothetical protein
MKSREPKIIPVVERTVKTWQVLIHDDIYLTRPTGRCNRRL